LDYLRLVSDVALDGEGVALILIHPICSAVGRTQVTIDYSHCSASFGKALHYAPAYAPASAGDYSHLPIESQQLGEW